MGLRDEGLMRRVCERDRQRVFERGRLFSAHALTTKMHLRHIQHLHRCREIDRQLRLIDRGQRPREDRFPHARRKLRAGIAGVGRARAGGTIEAQTPNLLAIMIEEGDHARALRKRSLRGGQCQRERASAGWKLEVMSLHFSTG